MEKDLLARRQQAQDSFDTLQNSINLIKQELQKYNANSVDDLEAELLRLQGEYRATGDLLDKVKKPKKKADTIDVTDVEGA